MLLWLTVEQKGVCPSLNGPFYGSSQELGDWSFHRFGREAELKVEREDHWSNWMSAGEKLSDCSLRILLAVQAVERTYQEDSSCLSLSRKDVVV